MQTRAPLMMAGLNPITFGRQARVTARIWVSPAMQIISQPMCDEFVEKWQEFADLFIEKREFLHNEWQKEALKLQLLKVLKSANITNPEEVKAKAMELGLGFMIPALMSETGVVDDDDDDDDDDIVLEMNEMMATSQDDNEQVRDGVESGNNNDSNHNHNRNRSNHNDKHEMEDDQDED